MVVAQKTKKLSICLFTWKDNDLEGLSDRDQESIKDVIVNLKYVSMLYLTDTFRPLAVMWI